MLGISGKDSLATAVILKAHSPDEWAETQLFTNDVKTEFPDKYAWLEKCEAYLEKPIQRIEANLVSIIKAKSTNGSNFLPSPKVRYCTRLSKIEPMKRQLGTDPVTLYIGLRWDEQDRKGYTPSETVEPKYPLIDHHIDLPKVFAILGAINLLPPSYFWERLYRRVEEILRERSPLFKVSLDDLLSPVQKYTLFRGRTRDNCYFCFYQRQAEWVWLLETYPDLFEQAIALEDAANGYTWCSGGGLRDHIIARKDEIFEKRAQKTAKQVEALIYGKTVEVDQDLLDLYAGGSCGLFCGK